MDYLFSMRSLKQIVLFSILIVAPACCRKKLEKKREARVEEPVLQQNNVVDDYFEREAKLDDIPIPVGYRCAMINSDASSPEFLSYKGGLTLDQALTFYKANMEGWLIDDFSTLHEGLLVCSKPDRSCVISIRSGTQSHDKEKKSVVNIILKNKPETVHVISDDINNREFFIT